MTLSDQAGGERGNGGDEGDGGEGCGTRGPWLPTLKVPLAVAAARLLGVPGRGLADEVPKPAHSQGLAQVIILLFYIWTQRGLLQGHPDLQAK